MLVRDQKKTKAQLLDELDDMRKKLDAGPPPAQEDELPGTARERIEDLERDNRLLKSQLAEQRGSRTVFAPALPRAGRSYRTLAIVLFVLALLFLAVALWLYFGRVQPLELQLTELQQKQELALITNTQLQQNIRTLEAKLNPELAAQITFGSGRTALSQQAIAAMKKISGVLKDRADKGIRIVGHADSRAIRSTSLAGFPSNWEISTHRAAAVARFLQRDAGIPPERMEVVGLGDTKPVGDNTTAVGRTQNRRVEIFIGR
jgi:flagellar motor protein MotB